MAGAQELTNREILLVVMLARGHTTDRVAREMRLSRHTVGERISILLERFGCRNRTELVAYFYAHGLLETGTWPPDTVVRVAVRTTDSGAAGLRSTNRRRYGSSVSDPVGAGSFRHSAEGGEANVV